MRLRRKRLAAILAALAILVCGAARADIQTQGTVPVPPAVVPVAVAVERGGEVTIRLRTLGRPPRGTRFLIRSKPTNGELRQDPPGGQRVLYRHSGEGDSDQFAFAAQAPGTGVSTPALVQIAVVEPQPVLVAPTLVDFGEFIAGDTVSKEMIIRNAGGGRLIGRLAVPPEIVLEGSERIDLGPSELLVIRLKLVWSRLARYSGTLAIETQLGRQPVSLVGDPVAPFEFAPVKVALEMFGGVRSGAATLRSHIQKPCVIEISGGEEYGLPGVVELGAGEERVLTLIVTEEQPDAKRSEIVFRRGRFERKLEAVAEALPARLKVEPGEFIDLGAIPAGLGSSFSFTVFNRGGQAGFAQILEVEDLTIPQAREPFQLGPGEGLRVEAVATPRRSGPFARDIVIRLGDQIRRLTLRADALLPSRGRDKGGMAATVPRFELPPSPARAEPDGDVGGGATELPGEPSVPRVDTPRLFRFGGGRAKIEWAHFPEADGYGIEQLFLSIREKGLHEEWLPYRKAKIVTEGSSARAELWGLPKFGWVMLRVRAFKGGEAVGAPSDELRFLIPRRNLPWGWMLLALSGGAGFWGWLAWRKRRNREGQFNAA